MRGTTQVWLGAWLLLPACADEPPTDDGHCEALVWAQPGRAGETLGVIGSWNDWGSPTSMRSFPEDPAWQLARLRLPPGAYGYLVVEEGRGRLDRHNGLTTFRDSDEQEVSLLQVDACDVPRASVLGVTPTDATTVELMVSVRPAQDGAPVQRFQVQGVALTGDDPDAAPLQGTLGLGLALPSEPGKHHATVAFADAEERTSAPLDVALWVDPVAERWSDGIVYQVMIDRFLADDGSALAPPPTPGSRAGGTLRGVTAALRDGWFSALGVSALWLSPVYQNPDAARPGVDGHLYEGYHGYWPTQPRVVDARIGGEAALHELVAEAHARGIRVLLDLVPNHVYEDHPIVADGMARGWFNVGEQGECVCGTPSCPWADHIRTCWFTSYLPDFHFEHPEVMQWVVDDAVWWQQTFDTDGFRIDAVPMMPRAATRRIVHALRKATGPRDAVFSIGEIFTGGGRFGTEDLRYHLGPDGLDSAFDFPLMWSLREAIATDGEGFAAVEAGLAYTDVALQGSGAESQLGRMIGNHDVTRFASVSAGDAGDDPWEEPPPQPSDPEVYARQRLALGLVLTLPGLPVIYYGDEVALAGAADPDNRRVMPDAAALSPEQSALLDDVRTLAQTRRCVASLRSGARQALVAGDTHYAFLRDAGDGRPALVVASRADAPTTLALDLPSTFADGSYADALGGPPLTVAGGRATLPLPAFGLAVFLAGPACG